MATETTKLLPSIDNPRILTSYYTVTVSQTLKLKCRYSSSCTQSFNWYFSALTNENFSHSNMYTRHDTTQHRSILSGCCDPCFPSPDLFSEYVNSPNNDPDSSYIPLKVSNQHPSSTEDLQASIKHVGRKFGTTLGSIWVPCEASPKSFSTSPQQSPWAHALQTGGFHNMRPFDHTTDVVKVTHMKCKVVIEG